MYRNAGTTDVGTGKGLRVFTKVRKAADIIVLCLSVCWPFRILTS